ncbi:MAG: hypothetical protein AB1393_11310 [Candidatus Edwardsbacteria bacterium]
MYHKADLCFILQRIEEAEALNNEALEMAEKVKRQEIIFESKILRTKIIAQKDIVLAREQLKDMLKESKEETQLASLHYELFKLTGEQESKTKALELYLRLYEKTPNIQYKERIEELEQAE